jgi:hypothetical protein
MRIRWLGRRVLVLALVGAGLPASSCVPRHVVQPGERLRIRTAYDDRIEGRLVRTSPDSVLIETGGGVIGIARGDANRVSSERAQPRWERVIDGVMAAANAAFAGYEMARDDSPRAAEKVLRVGLSTALAIQYGYRASLEKEWRPAKLPEAGETDP